MRVATTRAGLALVTAVLLGWGLLVACSTGSPQPSAQAPRADTSLAAGQQSTAAPLEGYAVSIPKLDLADLPLVPLGLNPDHTIQVPPLSAPKELGVYAKGPMPGKNGPSVILGHVNSGGVQGSFAQLSTLKAGDQVTSTAPDGRVTRYAVYRTVTVAKSAFPTSQVYSDVPTPELRLITCGPGPLDSTGHNYIDQTIVWARQV